MGPGNSEGTSELLELTEAGEEKGQTLKCLEMLLRLAPVKLTFGILSLLRWQSSLGCTLRYTDPRRCALHQKSFYFMDLAVQAKLNTLWTHVKKMTGMSRPSIMEPFGWTDMSGRPMFASMISVDKCGSIKCFDCGTDILLAPLSKDHIPTSVQPVESSSVPTFTPEDGIGGWEESLNTPHWLEDLPELSNLTWEHVRNWSPLSCEEEMWYYPSSGNENSEEDLRPPPFLDAEALLNVLDLVEFIY